MGGLFSLSLIFSLNLTLEALPGKGVVLIEVVHGIRCLDGEGVEIFVVVDVDRLHRGEVVGKRRNGHLLTMYISRETIVFCPKEPFLSVVCDI